MLNEWMYNDGTVFLYWLIYSLLCLPVVYILLGLLPVHLHSTKYLNFTFFYLLASSLFVFGILIVFTLLLIFFYLKKTEPEKHTIETANYPDFQQSPTIGQDSYGGEGYGFKVARAGKQPKAIRKKMLIAINQFESSSVNRINTAILSDDVDEIRLYAKSLIEKQERQISHHIKYFTEKLLNATDIKHAAYYKKQKALILWEQVYKDLLSNDNLMAALEKIQVLAKEAFQILIEDVELPILLAKIALKHGAFETAKQWLDVAKKNQAPDYKILSYLTEISFLERNFSYTKQLFRNSDTKGIIGLQPVAAFWKSHD